MPLSNTLALKGGTAIKLTIFNVSRLSVDIDMEFSKNVRTRRCQMVLETERLIHRPFREEDAADVYEYLKEPAVNCFACMKLHSLDEAKAEMKKCMGETEYFLQSWKKRAERWSAR